MILEYLVYTILYTEMFTVIWLRERERERLCVCMSEMGLIYTCISERECRDYRERETV